MRIERDMLGEIEIDDSCYYGINTKRAIYNFPISGTPIHPELVRALAVIKRAAALTNLDVGRIDPEIAKAIVSACEEIENGALADQFVVDSMQGGAGTSANMNINEVIANRAIELLGGKKGDYTLVHPIDHVNLSQSTNDVFPTAVRIAAIRMLRPVTELFADLQTALQEKEEEFSSIIKVGRTELQDAVPITLGQEFGSYAQAISRDRWRLYKVEERLRQVGIGGTAAGTGINAPRAYIFGVIEKLRALTGIGLARAEYMMDPIQNCDVFVEVSGLLKAAAVNISKIASDLRLMSSGPRAGFSEIKLPPVQAGSSIMPGKVNPVIAEAANQAAIQIMADDFAITMAAQSGQLELNAFLPLIAKNIFDMLDLFRSTLYIFTEKCIKGIEADRKHCEELINHSLSTVTALTGYIGYDKASEIAKKCINENKTVRQVLIENKIMDNEQIDSLLKPEIMTSPGIPGKERG
ncbi:MAG TPA: aspartate ammonia-lyase [Ruminiclostridium sp.]|nr:aspartate ammonia-lyase [Ruminiclostridium sp.]